MEQPTERDQDLILGAGYQQSTIVLYWHQMVHEKITDINKHLIGIASLLIPIIGSVALPDKFIQLNLSQKILVEVTLIVLIFSIVFGFFQFIHELLILKFFKDRNSKRAEAFYNNLNKTYKKTKIKADKFRIMNNPSWAFFPYCLTLQGLLIITALILIFSLVSSFLTN